EEQGPQCDELPSYSNPSGKHDARGGPCVAASRCRASVKFLACGAGDQREETMKLDHAKHSLSRRRMLQGAGAIKARLATPTFLRVSTALASYPEHPIKIVVANTPGGPSDISARMMAAEMQQVLGGSVFVENRGGAGGNIGYGYAARSEPDGYTILLTTT